MCSAFRQHPYGSIFMKRVKSINGIELYDLICDRDNIREAIRLACKDHAKDKSVIAIKMNPEPYVDKIHEILVNESFEYSRFKNKTIFERGKKRDLCFTQTDPDRIIQHAVFNIVGDILHKCIPKDEYAAIKGRGTHACSMALRKALWDCPWRTRYCLKIDIRHFFDNIDRNILFDMIKRKIKCRRTLNILHTIIFDAPGKKGLPIGLYSSQTLSVFYLHGLDHYCKETLGIKYYFRYMDDIVILASNKNHLHNYRRLISRYLSSMNLSLKQNHAIFPVDKRRIDFVGFVHDHKQVMIRKKTKKSYIRSCNKIIRYLKKNTPVSAHMIASKQSYEGIAGWATSDAIVEKYSGRVYRAIEFGLEAI